MRSKKITKITKALSNDVKGARYMKDGYLVIGCVVPHGCSTYVRKDKAVHVVKDRLRAEWETRKTVSSISEQRSVHNMANKSWLRLRNLGYHINSMGFMVPRENGPELEKTLKKISDEVEEYNRLAKYTSATMACSVFIVRGDDTRIAKTFYDETVTLLTELADAINSGSVPAIRAVLSKVGRVESMLPAETGARIKTLIDKTRADAKAALQQMKKSAVKSSEKIVKQFVNAAGINVMRADLVEVANKLDKKSSSFLPMIDARQIE